MNKIDIQNKILCAIGLSQEDYSTLVFETGVEYLEERAGNFATCISQTTSFWQWWTHSFEVIDEVFYASNHMLFDLYSAEYLIKIYLDFHAPKDFKGQIDRAIWQKAHELMIHQSIKEIVK